MNRLSVNVNKIALVRNARGAQLPNLLQMSIDAEKFGAQGVTVHPRPDERHIRYEDVVELKQVVTTELNVEGNPNDRFMQLIEEVKPHQVTLVPDAPEALTSDSGWDTIKHQEKLTDLVKTFKAWGIRTSIFIDPIDERLEGAAKIGTDRVEFYTGPYAHEYSVNPSKAVAPYQKVAHLCRELGLGINAGHDLNLSNLRFFVKALEGVDEVSIGHALVCDALYYGWENAIRMYRKQLAVE